MKNRHDLRAARIMRRKAEALRLLVKDSHERAGRLQIFSGQFEDDAGKVCPYMAVVATNPAVIEMLTVGFGGPPGEIIEEYDSRTDGRVR